MKSFAKGGVEASAWNFAFTSREDFAKLSFKTHLTVFLTGGLASGMDQFVGDWSSYSGYSLSETRASSMAFALASSTIGVVSVNRSKGKPLFSDSKSNKVELVSFKLFSSYFSN